MSVSTKKEVSWPTSCNTEKTDDLEISKNSGDEQDSEQNDPCQTEMPVKKAKCFPIAWLLFLSICLNLPVRPSAAKPTGVKCSNPNDIKYRNPKTGLIYQCSVCPECIPGQQYSIPCGSTVDLGILGQCVDCPAGTFSDKYDKKQCKICTKCTNKVYIQTCTKEQNAKCGSCIKGYTYDPHTFDCVKNTEFTSKTTVVPTTAKIITSTSSATTSAQPTTTTTTTKMTADSTQKRIPTSSEPQSYQGNHSTLPTVTEQPGIPSSLAKNDGKSSPSTTSQQTGPWFIATVIVLSIIATTSFVGFIAMSIRKIKKNPSSSIPETDEEAGIELIEMTNGDMKLKDFMEQQVDACDAICTSLFVNESLGGICYVYKLAAMFSLTNQEREAIKSAPRYKENPTRTLLETICAKNPSTTVRQFAYKVKSLKFCPKAKKVYKRLEPFFIVQQ